MKCVACGQEAVAVCRFCGRAVCSEHVCQGPALVLPAAPSTPADKPAAGLQVDGAVWCGLCHVKAIGRA